MQVMQLFTLVISLVPLQLLTAQASPVNLEKKNIDASSYCGQWDRVPAGRYALDLDQWNAGTATRGWQCAQIAGISGNTIAWQTTYDWVGGTQVKSFTSIELTSGINRQLSTIKSMPAVWKWSISTTTGIVADVAFDLFTSYTPGGSHVNELMIWMASFQAKPIAFQYTHNGIAQPLATGIQLGGHTWNLYSGSNGRNNVFSFVPTSGSITSFNADIFPFFRYLIQHNGVSSSEYLTTADAGLEATIGSATFSTSLYSLSVN